MYLADQKKLQKNIPLLHGLASRGRRELDMLQKILLEDLQKLGRGGDFALQSGFLPWDVKYYQRLLSSSCKIDESAMSEYFPLEHVIPAMLRIFEAALGLRFDSITEPELVEATIWQDTGFEKPNWGRKYPLTIVMSALPTAGDEG
ncbi:hypothetical protein NQ176_g3011 [Zarea fungicola]|uniref:Uncharacterized protein n=1 Tax=Zarea fungicola TaxID=93591 RepID=A0ACC1NMT1_9HYPO|nr:hypothetical protein NQ176_g3011 [Lecanicillium fungicola]